MTDALADYLKRFPAFSEQETLWPYGGGLPLLLRAGFADEPPPRQLLSSARAVVLRGAEVLTIRNAVEHSVLPGGRLEAGESPEDAVVREVAEESGWLIEPLTLIGYLHFRHLGPEPEDYPYLYPDFLQTVHLGRPHGFDEDRREHDEWVEWSGFLDIEIVQPLLSEEADRRFLDMALSARRR